MRSFFYAFLFTLSGISAYAKPFISHFPKKSRLGSASVKTEKPEVIQGHIKSYIYSGLFQRFHSWIFRPNYEYCIYDNKGDVVAFLDFSQFAAHTSFSHFIGKEVTVHGKTTPHKYRGVVVVQVKTLTGTTRDVK